MHLKEYILGIFPVSLLTFDIILCMVVHYP